MCVDAEGCVILAERHDQSHRHRLRLLGPDMEFRWDIGYVEDQTAFSIHSPSCLHRGVFYFVTGKDDHVRCVDLLRRR